MFKLGACASVWMQCASRTGRKRVSEREKNCRRRRRRRRRVVLIMSCVVPTVHPTPRSRTSYLFNVSFALVTIQIAPSLCSFALFLFTSFSSFFSLLPCSSDCRLLPKLPTILIPTLFYIFNILFIFVIFFLNYLQLLYFFKLQIEDGNEKNLMGVAWISAMTPT